MCSLAVAVLFALVSRLSTVSASIYVNNPVSTSTCYGGQPCTVTWLDNGQTPILSDIGAPTQSRDPTPVVSTSHLCLPNPRTPSSHGITQLYQLHVGGSHGQLTTHYTQYSSDFACVCSFHRFATISSL
ncbi:uncharacterized protein B0H18DRAFT_1009971, partial [Fomitopsis serialis]|uniref:uncharacterized protein n=1 Tax=Fomitopsis serialis TaxID=139415 RepID=UPI0020086297